MTTTTGISKGEAPQRTSAEVNQSLRSASAPIAPAGAANIGALMAIAVMALGLVALRDAAVSAGWLSGRSWLPAAAHAIDGLHSAAWMVPAGTVVALLGCVLIATGLAPRRRTALALSASTAVYVGRADLADVASAVAQGVPAVLRARSKASRRKVSVRCDVTTEDSGELRATIAAAIDAELAVLQRVPRVVVRTRTGARS